MKSLILIDAYKAKYFEDACKALGVEFSKVNEAKYNCSYYIDASINNFTTFYLANLMNEFYINELKLKS